jgi:regulator of protease activity HflC (stomatin/prohibitin superfamily)
MVTLIIIVILVVLFIIARGARIINQYERGVVFRLGKVQADVKQPGMRIVIPLLDNLRKVSLRITFLLMWQRLPIIKFLIPLRLLLR